MPQAGDTKFKSKVQKKTNDPLFGEVFTFQGVKGKYCELLISVWHKNFLASDNQIGQGTVSRAEVYGAGPDELTIPLKSNGGLTAGKQVGSITLRIIPQ
jgi:Ca2+-dependent lipid-binding protein